MERITKLIILVAIFITGLIVTNITSSKIMTLWGLTFSVGALAYAITFPITDTIGEVWGRKRAHVVVWAGFFGNVIMVVLIYLAMHSPSARF